MYEGEGCAEFSTFSRRFRRGGVFENLDIPFLVIFFYMQVDKAIEHKLKQSTQRPNHHESV